MEFVGPVPFYWALSTTIVHFWVSCEIFTALKILFGLRVLMAVKSGALEWDENVVRRWCWWAHKLLNVLWLGFKVKEKLIALEVRRKQYVVFSFTGLERCSSIWKSNQEWFQLCFWIKTGITFNTENIS